MAFMNSISYMGCHPNPIDELHHFSRLFLNHQPDSTYVVVNKWEVNLVNLQVMGSNRDHLDRFFRSQKFLTVSDFSGFFLGIDWDNCAEIVELFTLVNDCN